MFPKRKRINILDTAVRRNDEFLSQKSSFRECFAYGSGEPNIRNVVRVVSTKKTLEPGEDWCKEIPNNAVILKAPGVKFTHSCEGQRYLENKGKGKKRPQTYNGIVYEEISINNMQHRSGRRRHKHSY